MWRLGGAFWTWKDYNAWDHIKCRMLNELEKQRQRLLQGFRKLDIYEREDIEPFIDRMAEQVRQAMLKQRNWDKLEPYYTKRELGLRKVREVDPVGDKGGDEIQINKAIQKVGKRAEKQLKGEGKPRKWRKAREILETIASAGYYGYLVLRRKLGIPLEHPTLKPWYAKFLPWIPALINPGGLVFLREGVYKLTSPVTVQTSNLTLTGFGWATYLKPITNIDKTIHVDATSKNLENLILSNMCVSGVGEDGQANRFTIMLEAGTSAEKHYIKWALLEKLFCVDPVENTHILGWFEYAEDKDQNWVMIYNNYLHDGCTYRAQIYSPRNTWAWVVCNNTCVESKGYAILHGTVVANNNIYYPNNGVAAGKHYTVLVNNVIRDPLYKGIDVTYGIELFNMIIAHNTVLAYSRNHNYAIYAITMKRCILAYNSLGSYVSSYRGTNYQAIYLLRSTYNIIEDNHIVNPCIYNNNSYDAIFITDNGTEFSTHNILRGNIIYSFANNKPRYGIAENAAGDDYNIYEGNYIVGVATGAILVLGDNSLVRNNYGEAAKATIRTINADYSMTWADEVILADASSAAITITLPDPSAYPNVPIKIKKIDSSTNAVTIAPHGTETIDGASSYDLTAQNECITLISDGTNWYII